ncbi:hypothetical protein ES703_30911 [subsurface metagenome]
MEKIITSTEAVLNFSEILNEVKYKATHYRIIRNGKPIASIAPFEKNPTSKNLGELREILQALPQLGSEAADFDEDLRQIIKNQPLIPEANKWV